MVSPAIKQELERALEAMQVEQQHRVVEFARSLAQVHAEPANTVGSKLLPLVGTITNDDLDTMRRVIEEGCERVDPDGW